MQDITQQQQIFREKICFLYPQDSIFPAFAFWCTRQAQTAEHFIQNESNEWALAHKQFFLQVWKVVRLVKSPVGVYAIKARLPQV